MSTEPIEQLTLRVRDTLRPRWPHVSVRSLAELPGGASSRTLIAALEHGPAADVVVKIAPAGLAPIRNRDVLRQARVLDVLSRDRRVAVPEVFARDEGDPPDRPPLFLMQFVAGESVEPLHTTVALDPALTRSRALGAARMLGALHRTNPADLDEYAVTVEDEVARWVRALGTIDADTAVRAEQTGRELMSARPHDRLLGVCHGDWRLGNMLCADGDIKAVIDWEIWSLGDPRADLAWFLMECDPSHPAALAGSGAGMPELDVLVEAYEDAAGTTVTALSWFRALAAFKQIAACALIAKHNARRGVPVEAAAARISRLGNEMYEWMNGFLLRTRT